MKFVAKTVLLVGLLMGMTACGVSVAPKDPTAQRFPTVSGTALDGTAITVPEDLAGKPAVLLVGYAQKAQFDIDRWILGLMQLETPVRIMEIPTIAGMIPRQLSETIDGGMRKGIPEEDWPAVLTIYDDATKIIKAIGVTEPNNAHVVLLNGDGGIDWFHARGYSASKVMELNKRVKELNSGKGA